MKFIRFDQSVVQSTLEYWTAERMANAIPAPLLHVELESQQKDNEFAQVEREMFFCNNEDRRYHPLYAARADVTIDPYQKAGKLYYKSPDGRNCVGTAQFVGADNILLTAAHCLKDPGGAWSTMILFRRAERDGVADQSIDVVVSTLGIHDNWDINLGYPARYKWDFAFAKTTLKSTAGHLKLGKFIPYDLKAIGYPANYGNRSVYMCEARGKKGREGNGMVRMLGNFMESGSSGGAWFISDGSNQEVVGLNAGGDKKGNMYGPIFDQTIFDLLQDIINEKENSKKEKRWKIEDNLMEDSDDSDDSLFMISKRMKY